MTISDSMPYHEIHDVVSVVMFVGVRMQVVGRT